jgi:hypothetical protein
VEHSVTWNFIQIFKAPGMKITKSPSSTAPREQKYPDPHVLGAGPIGKCLVPVYLRTGEIEAIKGEMFSENWVRYVLDGKECWAKTA